MPTIPVYSLTIDAFWVWVGLGTPKSWLATVAFALMGLGVLIAYSPIADRLASRFIPQPPTLQAFGELQQSLAKLVAGIVIAWVLGGFLEELALRGIVLNLVRAVFSPRVGGPVAAGAGVLCAALGAGIVHLYQGRRGAAIITQLSVLFGVLYALSGYNLWVVMLCHGLYDTIAFIRFATKKSKYAKIETV